MTSPTGTTTRQSNRPTKRPVPPIVRTRQRLVLGADFGIAVILLGVPLRFIQEDTGLVAWFLGTMISVVAQVALRRSIRSQDNRPDDELDEYELLRRYKAQRTALLWAQGLLMIVWMTFSLLTLFRRQGPESFDTLIDSLYACLYATAAFLIFVPLVILRSIAGGMNRDLLISGEAEEIEDADALNTTASTTTREDPSLTP